jgi:hypothetical protein
LAKQEKSGPLSEHRVYL